MNSLVDLTACARMIIMQKRIEIFKCLKGWKKELILCQVEKSRACIKLFSNAVGVKEVKEL